MHLVLEVDRSRLNAGRGQGRARPRDGDHPQPRRPVRRRRAARSSARARTASRSSSRASPTAQRAIDLIGKTALLEFKLVRTPEEAKTVFDRLDGYLAARGVARRRRHVAAQHAAHRPLPRDRRRGVRPQRGSADGRAAARDRRASTRSIPPTRSCCGATPTTRMQGVTGRALYVVKREPEMTGGSIASAEARVGLEQTNPGAWGVSMKMTPKGRADFAARHRQQRRPPARDRARRRRVSSAPNHPRAHSRRATPRSPAASTSTTREGPRDRAARRRAARAGHDHRGALGRAVARLATRSSEGLTAGMIGTVLVIVFMAIYYQLSGLIAIAAMLLNLLYVIAALAGFGATLTLPGIAGLVLTVGMAVDTNVLIFERIREELRHGKSVRQSVRARLRPRVPHHPRRAPHDAHQRAVPVPVRHRPDQGLRRHAEHRPRREHVHGGAVHAHDLRLLAQPRQGRAAQHLRGEAPPCSSC